MQYIAIVKTIISLLPLIIQAVQAIEGALPEGGNGTAKLAVLKSVLENAFKLSSDMSIQFETLWTAISSVAGEVVKLFNAAGTFKKS